MTNESVLGAAQFPSITATLKERFQSLGYVHYLPGTGPLASAVSAGRDWRCVKAVGCPTFYFKDFAKRDVVVFKMPSNQWEELKVEARGGALFTGN